MTNTSLRNQDLKTLAKAVRSALRAAGVKASVRTSTTSVSEALNINVKSLPCDMQTAAEIAGAKADSLNGQITEAKRISNARREAVERIVFAIVTTDTDWGRFVFVNA